MTGSPGLKEGLEELPMGMEASKAKGIKDVAEQISLKISTDLAFSEVGNSGAQGYASRYLVSAVTAQTDQLKMSGFETDESYWERYAVAKAGGMTHVYDIYRSFTLRKSDYEEAKAGVLDKGKQEALRDNDQPAVDAINKLIERNSRKPDRF